MAMVKNSALVIQNLEAHNITAISYLLDVYVSNGIVLNNFTVVNCQTIGLPGLFSFKKSTVESVRNSNFVESQLLVFIFSNSLVKQFDSNVLNGMNRGIQVTERSNATVNNNVFKNMKQNIKEGGVYYAEIKEAGSAIEVINSNVEIENNTFVNNTAVKGGAIYIECNYLRECTNTIKHNSFVNNRAQDSGGAIKYNSYEPEMMNNTFSNNSAIFYPNIASYPVRIKTLTNGTHLEDIMVLDNVPSGIEIDDPIDLLVVSVGEKEVITSDSGSYIKLLVITPNSNVKGQNTVTLKDGKATFKSTVFYASPGKTNVKFKIESSAINKKMTQYLDSAKYADQIISVNFRWCKPGEIQIEDICIPCNAGSYSVKWNETR